MDCIARAAADVSDRIHVASTVENDPEQAVRELFRDFPLPELAGVICFCSSRYPLDQLAEALKKRADDLTIIGCTSSGELSPDGLAEDTITAIGFPASAFRMKAICLQDLERFDSAGAQREVRLLAAEAREDAACLGSDLHRAAIFLIDGLSHREEMLTVTLQDALGDIPLIGGSSGDGLAFRETFVFWDGAFRRDAAVIAVLTSSRPMHVFRAQHHRPGETKMVITKADSQSRVVFEINAEPAAEEYARLVGLRVEDLEPGIFAAHPPMVRAGGEYYVRSVQAANADGSLTFYCAIDEGLVLTLGEQTDVVANLSELFADLEGKVGPIDRVIGFDCVLNLVEVERRQLRGAVSAIYAEAGVIGFNTYGEQFHALHVNQTLSGLAIGR
ncbi:FIST N-terminal domain-containing protein [Sphingomonas kaistensis]|uniref:FIST N-terminal domain-containing protein n=1 Tax=Sphingomonas kaistensis TaxID=298708 RepID=A0ABZ2G3B5_9SPHN